MHHESRIMYGTVGAHAAAHDKDRLYLFLYLSVAMITTIHYSFIDGREEPLLMHVHLRYQHGLAPLLIRRRPLAVLTFYLGF